jgi:hypothetical protein
VALDLTAHLGNQPLAGLGEQLGQRERGNRLHHHGRENHCDDSRQKLWMRVILIEHLIHERLGNIGHDQQSHSVDDHQPHAGHEQPQTRG